MEVISIHKSYFHPWQKFHSSFSSTLSKAESAAVRKSRLFYEKILSRIFLGPKNFTAFILASSLCMIDDAHLIIPCTQHVRISLPF
jgi:hypothetical protein